MIGLVVFCLWILPKVVSFFMPFVIAGIVALIANPIVRFLEKKIKIKRKAGTFVVIVFVLAAVCFVIYAVIAKLIHEFIGFTQIAPQLWQDIVNTISKININANSKLFRNIGPDFNTTISKITNTIGDAIASGVHSQIFEILNPDGNSGIVSSVPTIIISFIMTILASYMFVADVEFLNKMRNKLFPDGTSSRVRIVIDSMKSAVGGYFSAQLKIMAVVYVVLLIGFTIMKVEFSALVALLIAILDFLPFFGTGTVMIPWAIVVLFQSNYKLALGIFVTWAISQIVRQVIQPKLLSDSMGLPPIPTLFLLYVGFRLGGALGLIFAVPIGMILYNLYKAGVFSNFIYSIKILYKDFTKIRRFTDDELKDEGIK